MSKHMAVVVYEMVGKGELGSWMTGSRYLTYMSSPPIAENRVQYNFRELDQLLRSSPSAQNLLRCSLEAKAIEHAWKIHPHKALQRRHK